MFGEFPKETIRFPPNLFIMKFSSSKGHACTQLGIIYSEIFSRHKIKAYNMKNRYQKKQI
jgi:hypothetical protein